MRNRMLYACNQRRKIARTYCIQRQHLCALTHDRVIRLPQMNNERMNKRCLQNELWQKRHYHDNGQKVLGFFYWERGREEEKGGARPSAMPARRLHNRRWRHISARHIGHNDSYFARDVVTGLAGQTGLMFQNSQLNSLVAFLPPISLTWRRVERRNICPEQTVLFTCVLKILPWHISIFVLNKLWFYISCIFWTTY